MIEEIERDFQMTQSYTGFESLDPAIARIMEEVPRHHFVPDDFQEQAYINRPLPIGLGQTISQPFIVALMTQCLNLKSNHSILEIGTGSGYQAAILSRLVKHVYSLEIIPALAESAKQLLQSFADNIYVAQGNGYQGLPEFAPYDGIIVTAAAPEIPQALIAQLKPGGRMVIPIGFPYAHQELMQLNKLMNDTITKKTILPVAFVPMTGAR